jgi:hypothetical protein
VKKKAVARGRGRLEVEQHELRRVRLGSGRVVVLRD